MKIFITGGTGYLGHSLSIKLAKAGHSIQLLVRNPDSNLIPRHPNIHVFKGDIHDPAIIARAMNGCNQVFHMAAAVKCRTKDPDEIFRTNVEGTFHVLEAAGKESVSRIVYTSTCGVIGSCIKEPMTENDPRISGFSFDYELSKKIAEDMVMQYSLKGLDTLVASPSKIYGPGIVSSGYNVNTALRKFLKRGIAFIPAPGSYQSCFAFIDDVVNGHLLAMEKGRTGEKYILGGVNISYRDFFNLAGEISGHQGRIIQLSKKAVKGWALLQMLNQMISGSPPLFTIKAIDRLFCNYCFSSDKAIHELGYRITPIREALQQTIHHLNNPLYA
ncbi:MAG: NAD-dependent epimerase/dehydratase family protein [Bacteroidota bacterium]|nr:NAD-dependent epimerase/dehydratase family protein [Bacteroidota bacterium]MDP4211998.1 NAD-dependent epimerase/dehydratase family protein [Bacteroidota bacterium]MDP4249934.1 NAD-dependent epimerase/dehydratase family protein [Bacteroidota bacterium]